MKNPRKISTKYYKFIAADDSSYDETRCPAKNVVSTRESIEKINNIYPDILYFVTCKKNYMYFLKINASNLACCLVSCQIIGRISGKISIYDFRVGLTKLCEDITETLTEIRYEAVDLDPPA